MASEPLELLPPAGPIQPGDMLYVVQNGSSRRTTVTELGVGGAGGYSYGSFAVSDIGASEILIDHIVRKAHTIADNFASFKVDAGVAPAADWVAEIQHNNAPIGTVTIDTLGAVTFSATAAIPVAVGAVMTLIAPAVADATIGRLRATFGGE